VHEVWWTTHRISIPHTQILCSDMKRPEREPDHWSISVSRCYSIPSRPRTPCWLAYTSNFKPVIYCLRFQIHFRVNVGRKIEIEWDGMDWIDLDQDKDHWRALVNTAMNLRAP
jgi:hypothetical protein